MHLFLPTKIHTLFAHNRFSALKMPESEKINLESWIIDFRNVQVSLSHVSLSLNACKVMEAFLIFSHQKLKKIIITLQALGFNLKCLNETCIS